MSLDRRRLLCSSGASIFSFALWASSPWLVGTREPWDAELPFYYTGLIGAAGALLGAAWPGRPVTAFLGFWAGQVMALATLPGHDRTWIYLGVATTGVGSLIGWAGYVAGALLRVALAGIDARTDMADAPAGARAWLRYARLAVIRLCWLPIVLRLASASAGRVDGWEAISAEFVLLYASVVSSALLAFVGGTALAAARRRADLDPVLAACTLVAASVSIAALVG